MPDEQSKPPSSEKPSITTQTVRKKFVPPVAKKPPTQPTTSSSSSGTSTTKAKEEDAEENIRYFSVMHTKDVKKKKKKYDDGVFVVKKNRYLLLDTNGKKIFEKLESKTFDVIKAGETMEFSGRLIEIMDIIPPEDYISGKIFLQYKTSTEVKTTTLKPSPKVNTQFKAHKQAKNNDTQEIVLQNMLKNLPKTPANAIVINEGHPLHDDSQRPIYDVYIDAFLAKLMRPHQVEGVKFMYECVMGMKKFQGRGCLLADEMGLGKTLQTIALLWVLSQRGPYATPVIKKAIVVTNSSLVHNWRKEFKKWLGDERLKPLVVGSKSKNVDPEQIIKDFKSSYHKVLIISYNMCINYAKDLANVKADILVCDEGHKLKNSGIKIFQSLKQIQTPKRILLTGTPLQNDLSEFFSIVDFINPGVLGESSQFKNLFTDPITKSREPNSTSSEKKIGIARSQELNTLTTQFILRRTNELLAKHLPPKSEYLLFTGMTELQRKLYKYFLKSKFLFTMMSGKEDSYFTRNALACIQSLKKLLIHPAMIYNQQQDAEVDASTSQEMWKESVKLFPNQFKTSIEEDDYDTEYSSKMFLLEILLQQIQQVGDRVVVVSNFTSILDQVEKLCQKKEYDWFRLDGSTPSDKRMEIVDKFNYPTNSTFVFLLSSRAGGCGLNLIGANRIILLEPDFNPSNDAQAMARVYRDGQKKQVYIYRMIATGSIEEKIYQRQMVKEGLSKTVVDETAVKAAFSKEFLKKLFVYQEDVICETFAEEVKNTNSNGITEQLKNNDQILFKSIQQANQKIDNIVTFVKMVSGNDSELYKMSIEADAQEKEGEDKEDEESKEDEEEGENKVSNFDEEADFDFAEASNQNTEENSSDDEVEELESDEPQKKKQKTE